MYSALEDIVGSENVSDHPAIIDSYRLARLGLGQLYSAIVMPKDTFEVQAIVKLCNRHKVPFKATSTSFSMPYSDPAGPNAIKLDLKRMNHIVEINERSLYAVVEPYVITAELQAELMKRGLNLNVAGCGVNASALPFAAHQGIGHTGETTSYRERNILGVEWVTPEGEIVRMGSLGSGGEWFCGDGPGPSLRGIVMGTVSPLGGMGVFTRAGMKVYPWPGPAGFNTEGVSPHYLPKEMPDNFFYAYYSFPTMDDMCEAQRKIGESEIAFQVMAFNVAMVAANMGTSNPETIELLEQFRKQIQGRGFQVILAGNSAADFEYKRRVLKQIMDEHHGKSLEALDDPKIAAGFIWRCTRISASIRECFRMRGLTSFGGFIGGTYPFGKELRTMAKIAKVKERLMDEGIFHDDGGGYGAGILGWTHELGHLGHGEMLIHTTKDSLSPEAAAGLGELSAEAFKVAIETCYGVPGHVWGDAMHEMFGPHACNYHLWMRKVRQAFDPNDLSDAMCYITARGSEAENVPAVVES
jgi:glycolate oxidase